MNSEPTSFDLGDIQFYWRTRPERNVAPEDVPAFLPFEFGYLENPGLIIQKRNPLVLDWLTKVYSADSNVGYLQEGHGLAEAYGTDFINFVKSLLAEMPEPRSALEIGCGGGYLLKRLQALGFSCTGVDPSPVAARSAAKLGFELVEDFYPPANLPRPTSLVFHYDVLEHVTDPVAFLGEHRRHLLPGGMIVVAVPDCTKNIACGDISMAIHEHLNYFDEDSLGRTVTAAGFAIKRIQRSSYGGVLYCAATVAEVPEKVQGGSVESFRKFADSADRLRKNFCAYIEEVRAREDATLGIYVPIRSMPYLAKLGLADGFRFFDDEPTLHRRFFDGYFPPVENRQDLLANPPTDLIITSFAFDRVIAEAVTKSLSSPIRIRSLRDFSGLPG